MLGVRSDTPSDVLSLTATCYHTITLSYAIGIIRLQPGGLRIRNTIL